MSSENLSPAVIKLLKQIESGKFLLPGLPDIAVEIRELVANPDSNVADLTRLVEKDPVLSARIVSLANSAAIKGVAEISNVSMAIGRMGIRMAGNTAMGLALEQAFSASDPVIQQEMRAHWHYSTLVANAAVVLCKETGVGESDEVMLAALLHHIGALALLKHADSESELRNSVESRQQIITGAAGMVGDFAVCVWSLPEKYSRLARDVFQFTSNKEVSELVHLIRVAICLVGMRYLVPTILPEWPLIQSFERIGLPAESDSEQINAILKKIEESSVRQA